MNMSISVPSKPWIMWPDRKRIAWLNRRVKEYPYKVKTKRPGLHPDVVDRSTKGNLTYLPIKDGDITIWMFELQEDAVWLMNNG